MSNEIYEVRVPLADMQHGVIPAGVFSLAAERRKDSRP